MNRNYLYITLRLLFVLVMVVGGCLAVYFIAKVTVPFIIAAITALLINPLVDFLDHKAKMPRSLAVLLALILIVALIVGLIALLIIEMIAGLKYLTLIVPNKIQDLIQYFDHVLASTLMPLYNKVLDLFQNLDTDQKQTVLTQVQEIGKKLTGLLGELGQSIVSALTNFMAGLPNLAVILVFALLATFFISKDWHKIAGTVTPYLPSPVTSHMGRIYHQFKKAILGFIRAQLTLISITALIDFVGLLILHVDYALTIAIITGIIDLLPYLGTGVVFVPWITYTFFSGDYFLTIGLSVLFAVVLIQRQLMEPKIISSNVGLKPLPTLIAIFIALQLFGFFGFIIGPVVLVLIKVLHQARIFHSLWQFILGDSA